MERSKIRDHSIRLRGLPRIPLGSMRATIRLRREPSAEHLDLAVERHEAGLDRELGLTFLHLLAEFGERGAMRFGLDLRVCDLRFAIRDLRGTAVAMIDRDHLRNVMQLNRSREIVPERLLPVLEGRRDHPDGSARKD